MSELGRALRVYPTLLRIGLAEAVAYRAEFLVWMLTMSMPLVMLALMRAVAAEGAIGGFDASAFTAYYLATMIVRQLSGSWVVWQLNMEIREGTLSMKLLRPMHPLLGYSAESLSAIPLRVVVSLPLAVIALLVTSAAHVVRDPVVGLAFIPAILGAWFLNYCVMAIVGTLALFIQSAISIFDVWLGLFAILSGYLLPLALFPPWLQTLARYTPFPYLVSLPVEILIGKATRADVGFGLLVQWSYGLSAFVVMRWLWRRGVARFQAFGG